LDSCTLIEAGACSTPVSSNRAPTASFPAGTASDPVTCTVAVDSVLVVLVFVVVEPAGAEVDVPAWTDPAVRPPGRAASAIVGHTSAVPIRPALTNASVLAAVRRTLGA
jgi:hypothetical protein